MDGAPGGIGGVWTREVSAGRAAVAAEAALALRALRRAGLARGGCCFGSVGRAGGRADGHPRPSGPRPALPGGRFLVRQAVTEAAPEIDRAQRLLHPPEGLGAAEEQGAGACQPARRFGDDVGLQLLAKVDQDVAQQDEVEGGLLQAVGEAREVHLAVVDPGSQTRIELVQRPLARERRGEHLRRDARHGALAVDPAARVGERLGVEIGRQDPPVPAGEQRRIVEHQRERRRLFAGRAGGAPAAQAARARAGEDELG